MVPGSVQDGGLPRPAHQKREQEGMQHLQVTLCGAEEVLAPRKEWVIARLQLGLPPAERRIVGRKEGACSPLHSLSWNTRPGRNFVKVGIVGRCSERSPPGRRPAFPWAMDRGAWRSSSSFWGGRLPLPTGSCCIPAWWKRSRSSTPASWSIPPREVSGMCTWCRKLGALG
jgi:hypothetical protein